MCKNSYKKLTDVLVWLAENDAREPVEYILFDLDGTLTDPGFGITNSVMYALRKMGVEPPAREELYSFIGPPLIESFCKFYNMSEEDARKALAYYREYFSVRGLFENEPYEGIHTLLETLRSKGYKLAVATSKPEPFSRQILEHFDLIQYFDFVAGSLMNETRTDKAEVISYALDSLNINNEAMKRRVLMVGDRRHDIIGAHRCGVRCVGVLYGYGNEAEMAECGADFTVAGV